MLTVESLVSLIFLPMSLFIHSACLESPPELRPGTTRGIVIKLLGNRIVYFKAVLTLLEFFVNTRIRTSNRLFS